MVATLSSLLGGIGLFLLGMVLLTDGLKAFAGPSLRRALLRFTGTPLAAFFSGALLTCVVQSSSATTVAVIGFVSAGLLTFPQALGAVFGASLGNTGTGWIVSVLGLKVSLGTYALPAIFLGALFKLLGSRRWKEPGLAIAAVGMIFLGIDLLQQSLSDLAGILPFATLPGNSLFGHIVTVAIGLAFTMVMQSSSASIAITLTALHSGAVSFEQAAALVIGASIGTTFTALLASAGAGTPAKRTALAFVLFNLAAGSLALVLLPGFFDVILWAQIRLGLEPGAMSLAAFHTLFIALGAAVFMPLLRPFARLIEWLIPERGPTLTRHLDDLLLENPAVALEASRRALGQTFLATVEAISTEFHNGKNKEGAEATHDRIGTAIERIEQFLSRIPPEVPGASPGSSRVSQMHIIDHLIRLHSRISVPDGVREAMGEECLREATAAAASLTTSAAEGLRGSGAVDWAESVRETAARIAEMRRRNRVSILESASAEGKSPDETLQLLDAMRWLDRVGYHTWRICEHLSTPPTTSLQTDGREPHPDE